jgi:large subunit ribosomal protein L3|tara:strand:- start:1308 stop:1946 length:639 start_codon:yes stop_codon:yes gene_type:complete
MTIGLVGKKQGMTRIFTPEGEGYAVSVVSVNPNTITQIKSFEVDGYSSVQVTTGEKKEKHIKKPISGHYKKKGINPGDGLWEFRVDPEKLEDLEVGGQLFLEQFEEGQSVDVQGKSKGKGFAGTVKRWNFKMQDASHGNSISHRAPGSIGQCQTPGKVWKGKKMSGHMGDERKTIQNLKIASIDLNNNLLLIKGSIPGPTGSNVILKPSIKQ